MSKKILEKIVEPDKIFVDSTFKLKVKVQFIQSYNLITENDYNIITENEENLITEGDYYE